MAIPYDNGLNQLLGLSQMPTNSYEFGGQAFTTQELWCKISEKMNIIISHFNYIDKITSDNNKAMSLKLDYLLGQGLNESVSQELLNRINDGTIGSLINGTLLKEINDNVTILSDIVDKKASKVFVTPEEYGAYGDGVHDDTISIQSALNQNKDVYLGQNYLISDELIVTSNNISIHGGGKLYIPSSITLKSIIKLVNSNNVVIKDLKLYSINDKAPIIPNGHVTRPNAVSSNIAGIHIIKSSNIKCQNLEFNSMLFDFHIIDEYSSNSFSNNNITIENIISNEAQSGVLMGMTNNVTIKNYTFIPASIGAGGYHFVYATYRVGKLLIDNVKVHCPSIYHDSTFDFANYQDSGEDAFVLDATVTNFDVISPCLTNERYKHNLVKFSNGKFLGMEGMSENGVTKYLPTIAFHELKNGSSSITTEYFSNCYFGTHVSSTKPLILNLRRDDEKITGNMVFDNCTFENFGVGFSSSPINSYFKNCIFTQGDTELGICKLYNQIADTIIKFENCTINSNLAFPFTMRGSVGKLIIDKCTVTSSESILYNGNLEGRIELIQSKFNTPKTLGDNSCINIKIINCILNNNIILNTTNNNITFNASLKKYMNPIIIQQNVSFVAGVATIDLSTFTNKNIALACFASMGYGDDNIIVSANIDISSKICTLKSKNITTHTGDTFERYISLQFYEVI